MKTDARNEKWSEWKDWHRKGLCPVPFGVKVQYKLKHGDIGGPCNAEILDWNDNGKDYDIIAYRYKIKETESDIHPDLKWLAGNVSEWKKGYDLLAKREGGGGSLFEKIDSANYDQNCDFYGKRFTFPQWQAARQQLGLDQPEVTPEEDEAWQDKERDMSIEEARAILSGDNVNHPRHYQSDNGIECIDAIRAALGLDGFVAHCRGTAIKYAFRAGKKQAHAEDLRKAAWYLTRAAEALEE